MRTNISDVTFRGVRSGLPTLPIRRNSLSVAEVMTEPSYPIKDVLVTLVRIPGGSVLVSFETARRVQQRMSEENPGEYVEVPELPCVTYTPTTSEELEDAIYAKISQLAEYLKDLMAAYPGKEFASVLWLNSQGQLTASVRTDGPGLTLQGSTTARWSP